MKSILEKLKSRKLWLAIIGAAAGVAIAFGADESVVQTVVGAATALISVMTYIITEGKVDAKAVELSADFVNQLIDAIDAIEAAGAAKTTAVVVEGNAAPDIQPSDPT